MEAAYLLAALAKAWSYLLLFAYIIVPLLVMVVVFFLAQNPQRRAKLDAWLAKRQAQRAAEEAREQRH